MRNKRIITSPLAIILGLPALFYAALYWPLPFDRDLKAVTSPDGTRVAIYSWRPCGVVGAFTKCNPWVYLTVRDRVSGTIISRYSFWADVPEEAEERLGDRLPW